MAKKLAVLSVNYDQYEVTNRFIESFASETDCEYMIFLADLSVTKKPFPSNEHLEIIPGENKGYAYGVNLALKHARRENFDSFVVINNDTYVKPDFVKNTLMSLEKNKGSIIGGKIYYASGHEYHKERYSKNELGKIIWYAGGSVDWNNVYINHRGVDDVDKKQYNAVEQTGFVTGCLMAFDNYVVNTIGLWDEGYFLYYEDADYCERAKRKKIRLFYDPSIVIWHLNATSTGGSGSSFHEKYQNRNRIKFGFKYAPFKTKAHLLKNYFLR